MADNDQNSDVYDDIEKRVRENGMKRRDSASEEYELEFRDNSVVGGYPGGFGLSSF